MSSPRKGGGKTAAWGDVSGRERPPITAPGRALFAVVLSPRDVDDPEDARANVRANLASAPPQYRIVELEWGAVAFLGDGVPSPDAGPAHAPQVLERPDALVVLVSHTLTARDVGEAFTRACQAHAEPKARAIGLKMKLRELSVDAKFSFVLIDKVNGRVFAASTALSSPLALGHATDGTLLVTCTRSGARAATSWPPRWAKDSPKGRSGGNGGAGAGAGTGKGQRQHQHQPGVAYQFGQSPVTPLHPPSSRASSQRSVSPDRGADGRERSRSPSSLSESSAGASSMGDWAHYQSLVTTNLTHLPAGRFVYGRRYLQPFEFSAFWHSAETNRAGARAARCEEPGADGGDGPAVHTNTAGTNRGEPLVSGGGQTSCSSVASGDASFGTAARRRRNSGGGGSFWGSNSGRVGATGEWRRREPDGRGAGPPTPPPPGSSSASRRSPPIPVPCAKPRESHGATWPGFDASTRARDKAAAAAAWVPRGRWTNERRVNEALEAVPVNSGDVNDALARTSLGSPKASHGSLAPARASELTRALSQPSALASH